MEILLFILVSAGIIVILGPNVLIIISTSITHGRVRGLQTVAGTSTAMAIQLLIAALGTSYLVSNLATGFLWLKWLGAAYLMYLGIKHLFLAFRRQQSAPQVSAMGSFQRGFWVSLTNPKTILFFGAFLPQFTVLSSSYESQIALLSLVFLGLAVLFDSAYAILSSRLAALTSSQSLAKYQNGISGVLYCAASSLLAGTKHA
jgi:homoserine/homoserine lactone efflux protein